MERNERSIEILLMKNESKYAAITQQNADFITS